MTTNNNTYVTYIIGVNASKSSYKPGFQWFNVVGNGSVLASANLNDFQAYCYEKNPNFFDYPINASSPQQIYLLDDGNYYQTNTLPPYNPIIFQVNEPSGDNIQALIAYSVLFNKNSYNPQNDINSFFASSEVVSSGWTPTGLVLYGLGKVYNPTPNDQYNQEIAFLIQNFRTPLNGVLKTIQTFYPNATFSTSNSTVDLAGKIVIFPYNCGCRTIAMNIMRMYGDLNGSINCLAGLNNASLIAGRKPQQYNGIGYGIGYENKNKNNMLLLLLILSIFFFIAMLVFMILYITSKRN
jgi:hypothetical protein